MSGADPQHGARGARGRAATGLGLLALLLLYAAFLHHGLGPTPDGPIRAWSPRGFLLLQSWVAPFEASPGLGVAVFSLPALALAVGVFLLTGSAVARTAAVACVLASALFSFYGLRPPGPGIWRFFDWRGSAVMVGLAAVLAATATAPLLARSWLRLPLAARLAVYVPVFVVVVAVLRNVTGTDPTLRFSISPWPVVPLFGITIGSVAVLGILAGMACAGWAFTRKGAARWAALLVAILLPALWFKLWHTSFPARGMLALSLLGAVCAATVWIGARGDGLVARARHFAWGFALVLAPLAVGEALASFDYTRTREGKAREIIDALDAYYQQHEEYPESLEELVDGDYLERIPRPEIGFGFLGDDEEFAYQSFGISYNLEFSAPDWVQCAFNPAWTEEDWEEEEEEAEAEEEEEEAPMADGEHALDESWSCPSSPPELW